MLDRQQIYNKLYDSRYPTELQTMARPDTDLASRRANIYAVKNTNSIYLELRSMTPSEQHAALNHIKAK